MATYITGATQILSIWDGSDSYDPIACLQSNALSSERDVNEVPLTKCDYDTGTSSFSNKHIVLGGRTETASFEGLTTETETGKNTYIQLKTLFDAGTLKTYKLSNVDGTNDLYFNGYITTLELNSPNEERSTFSGEVRADQDGSSTTEPSTKY